MKRDWFLNGLAAIVLAAATVAAYANGLHSAFLFDDDESIMWNPSIRKLWTWRIFFPPHGGATASGRPLFNASLALNWAWSRNDPWSYHVVSLVLHILAGWLLFGLVRRMLIRLHHAPNVARWLGLSVALLWLLHPLQTETVTYTVQRSELLMGLFYLAVIYCLVRLAEAQEAGRSGWQWCLLGGLACLSGMVSKEVMVSAPVIAFLFDWAFLSRADGPGWRRRWPFWILLCATWVPLALDVYFNRDRGGTSGFDVGLNPITYWLTQGLAILTYLKLTLWPNPLVLDYAIVRDWTGNTGLELPADAVVLALLGVAVWLLIRRPRWGVLALSGFAILAPTSIMPGNRQTLAEHRMYLVLAPLLAAAVIAFWHLTARVHRLWFAAGIGVLAVACAARVYVRNQDYNHPEKLWRDDIKAAPQNYFAMCNLGAELYREGKSAEAEQEFRDAVAVNPNYAPSASNLAVVLVAEHRAAEAIPFLQAALHDNPKSFQVANNMGVALADQHRWEEAIPWYQRALTIRSDYPDAISNLKTALEHASEAHFQAGMKLASQAHYREAVEEYEQALHFNPGLPNAFADMGVAWLAAGDTANAEAALRKALALSPALASAHYDLGLVLKAKGDREGTLREYSAAVKLDPDLTEATNNLAIVLWEAGRREEARRLVGEFLRRHPDDAVINATQRAMNSAH